jgi:two-component system sensor histidine kinase DesK
VPADPPAGVNERYVDQFTLTRTGGGMPSGAWWPEGGSPPSPWMRGWWKLIFPGVFLAYLLQTAQDIGTYSTAAPAAVVGYAVLIAFSVLYLCAVPRTWGGVHGSFWWIYAGMVVLYVAEMPFAHEGASVMVVYLVVLSVSALGFRALPVVAVWIAVAVFGPALVPAWGIGVDTASAVTIPVVALAMFGFFGVVQANRQLSAARAEVARLAAENERSRIARDLHDLLGHSLTTITVKAALARRLAGRDPDRAAQEIAEVEELSRQALAEVRAAVADYREVTLAGELATGAELLRADGIAADLPGAVDVVAPDLRPLFGWVVREGLTNVVRHAGASACTVTMGPTWVEIIDNGTGGRGTGDGSGLRGLRERVDAAGGTLSAGPAPDGSGWRLRADVGAVHPDAAAPAGECDRVAR